MAMAERTVVGPSVHPRTLLAGAGYPARLAWRSASALGRFFVGSGGSGPRGYPREGFPEIELHEIMAGRRDRFDGLL